MLRDFENKALAFILGMQRVQDRRQFAIELNVNDGAVTCVIRPSELVCILCFPFD